MGSNQRRQRTEFSKDEAIHDEATSVSFGVYSAEEIRKLSVVEIVNPLSFNQLGHPVPGGLYDLHMGPFTGKPFYILCSAYLWGILSQSCSSIRPSLVSRIFSVFDMFLFSMFSKKQENMFSACFQIKKSVQHRKI